MLETGTIKEAVQALPVDYLSNEPKCRIRNLAKGLLKLMWGTKEVLQGTFTTFEEISRLRAGVVATALDLRPDCTERRIDEMRVRRIQRAWKNGELYDPLKDSLFQCIIRQMRERDLKNQLDKSEMETNDAEWDEAKSAT
ncbi:hypothetical protein HDU93_009725 [Gonapodya sp. JEL0774]|nr:hypothetical protein HDU93_009725 [Gonapodya sp. JEL0774]